MIITISDKSLEDLSLISPHLAGEVAQQFSQLTIATIKEGPANQKQNVQALSKRLGVDAESLRVGVESLSFLLLEASKSMISVDDLKESMAEVKGLSDEAKETFAQDYLEHRGDMRSLLTSHSMSLPSLSGLDWRFELIEATRSSHALSQAAQGVFTLKLQLDGGDGNEGKSKDLMLASDWETLNYVTAQLESALVEAKSIHSRKVARNVK